MDLNTRLKLAREGVVTKIDRYYIYMYIDVSLEFEIFSQWGNRDQRILFL